ncbi:MAG: replication initiator protein A [Nitrospira sp.]|nr:replication initiator protein A [Nitrospira sp.]HQY59220.1 replication initiator protein A [Nitrospira sp.]
MDAVIIPEPTFIQSERILNRHQIWSVKASKGVRTAHKKSIVSEVKVGDELHRHCLTVYGGDGLPNTLDLEFFRAMEQVLTEQQRKKEDAPLEQTVVLRAKDIIEAAGKKKCGSAYRELRRFFVRLGATALGLEITEPGRRGQEQLVHIFENLTQVLDEDAGPQNMQVHRIRLADWYVESFNSGNCWVVDHALFTRLTRPISQLLHQALHALFPDGGGEARIRYAELVRNWQLTPRSGLSKIREQLDPAHQELQSLGFLDGWGYTALNGDKNDLQVRWVAGPAWWEADRACRHLGLASQLPDGIRDPLLPFRAPATKLHEEEESRIKATVAEVLDFVGIKDKRFTPFWTQAARDIPLTRIRKLIGDVRERVMCGQRGGAKDDRVMNRGAYLLSLLKLEARKRQLSWGDKN